MKMGGRFLGFPLFLVALWGCAPETSEGVDADRGEPDDLSTEPEPARYQFALPEGFVRPYVPSDNPMSEAKVELGRYLFYDERLSGNGTQSCATCHRQELAFTDGLAHPEGSTGDQVPRSSMSLVNVAYMYPFTWFDPRPHTLEEQVLIPLFSEAPVELGLTGRLDEVLDRLRTEPIYQKLFPRAFPEEEEPLTVDSIAKALSAFERTLISAASPFDRYAYGGDEEAISEAAKLGFSLFNTERFECYHCHPGPNFTTSFRSASSSGLSKDYQNNGLYNLDGEGSYPAESPGLVAVSGHSEHRGKFRVPTLRNIALTAPYMHDGSIATLEEVLDHYAAGGRLIEEGPYAGDGRENPNKSVFVRGFTATREEREALLAFLESLTDESVLTDARFAQPWSKD